MLFLALHILFAEHTKFIFLASFKMSASVYGLFAEELCLYVGCTIRKLKYRETRHRHELNACSSRNIPSDCEWKIRLIEVCEANIKHERELYWYNELKPFYNHNVPYISVSQPEYQHEYYNRTKELKMAYKFKNLVKIQEQDQARYYNRLSPDHQKRYLYRKTRRDLNSGYKESEVQPLLVQPVTTSITQGVFNVKWS